MGITERREREKLERRKTILNSAKELILLQGAERVSMEDIARKAEISKATVYLYFSGKELLFNQICEDAAQNFLKYLVPLTETKLTGIKAIKYIWRCYVELFGSSDEMLIIHKIRNYLNPGEPLVSLDDKSSDSVDLILVTLRTFIEQCKDEGIFDPNLDSLLATRLLLSMFSNSLNEISRVPVETRKSPEFIEKITKTFQIVIYGFAKDGTDRLDLDISSDLDC